MLTLTLALTLLLSTCSTLPLTEDTADQITKDNDAGGPFEQKQLTTNTDRMSDVTRPEEERTWLDLSSVIGCPDNDHLFSSLWQDQINRVIFLLNVTWKTDLDQHTALTFDLLDQLYHHQFEGVMGLLNNFYNRVLNNSTISVSNENENKLNDMQDKQVIDILRIMHSNKNTVLDLTKNNSISDKHVMLSSILQQQQNSILGVLNDTKNKALKLHINITRDTYDLLSSALQETLRIITSYIGWVPGKIVNIGKRNIDFSKINVTSANYDLLSSLLQQQTNSILNIAHNIGKRSIDFSKINVTSANYNLLSSLLQQQTNSLLNIAHNIGKRSIDWSKINVTSANYDLLSSLLQQQTNSLLNIAHNIGKRSIDFSKINVTSAIYDLLIGIIQQ